MIDSFFGEYRFLSNFYFSPFVYQEVKYNTVEHAFQAAKTLDPIEKHAILNALTPGRVKRIARDVTLRSDWEEIKLSVMERFVREKFTQNKDLLDRLIATGNEELVEGNTWKDTYWGICNGVGENHLGKILMELRNRSAKGGGVDE